MAYLETEVEMSSEAQVLHQPVYNLSLLRNFVNKENIIQTASVCLKDDATSICLNTHKLIQIGEKDIVYSDQINTYVVNGGNYHFEIGAVPSAQISQSTTIDKIKLYWYTVGKEQTLSFSPEYPKETITLSQDIQVGIPKSASPYSSFFRPGKDIFSFPLDTCINDGINNRFIRYSKQTQGIYVYNAGCDSYLEQHFKYNFQSPYLLSYEYWVGAGQQPTLVIGKKGEDLFSERLSLYQGYPNIPGLRMLQDPVHFVTGSRLLEPQLTSETYQTDMNTRIFQYNATEFVWALKSYDMVEYPLDWYWMRLTPPHAQEGFTMAPISYEQILPSLWKVNIGGNTTQLIRFSQGYDNQWGVYEGLMGVFFGKSIAQSIRCDGYANCFEIPGGKGERAYYIFYWPERLSAMGWLMTLSTVIFCVILCNRSKNDADT